MKRAFTLIEVSIAIVALSSCILGLVALFSLGLRENRQSVEDVATAGFADAVFAPLVAGLSRMDLKWDEWCQAVPDVDVSKYRCNGLRPENGWSAYIEECKDNRNYNSYKVRSDCSDMARQVFDNIRTAVNPQGNNLQEWPLPRNDSNGHRYSYGLVATRRGSTISLAFRASRRVQQLFAAPVYYAEVHFQGVVQ